MAVTRCFTILLVAHTGAALRVAPRRAVVREAAFAIAWLPAAARARCADLESCREIGEAKVAAAEAANPTVRLADGVRYKVLAGGAGAAVVAPGGVADVAYEVSTAAGAYMYSRGFGFEKEPGGAPDVTDFLRVRLGARDVPAGVEAALVGMRVGERRRVELPPGPATGFETSDWRPAPTTRRGRAQIVAYRNLVAGDGSSRPPFPALTVWEVEVRRVGAK